jgi:hypothetical protein
MTPDAPDNRPPSVGPARDSAENPRLPRRRPLWLAVPGAASVASVVLAVTERSEPSMAIVVQLACIGTAVAWVAAAALLTLRAGGIRRGLRPASWFPALAIVLAAGALRYLMLSYVPFPGRAGFEELQMGADGHMVLTTHVLELEFRFSKLAAALGLWLGGPTIEALRMPFRLMGYGSLAVLVLCLRALRVGWWPTALMTVIAAASRWFVIGAGVAYEDFSPVFAMLLLVWCLIRTDPARASGAAWGGAAGLFAGILMFENSSFRFTIVLAGGWLLWLAVRGRRATAGGADRHWRPLALFAATLVVVSAPLLVDIVHSGVNSVFFEALLRYGRERSSVVTPLFWSNLEQAFALVAGLTVRISFFLAPEVGHAVHPLVGALLMLGLVGALVHPREPFLRAVALATLLAVGVCCAATNIFAASRLAPVFPLLLLDAGGALEDLGGLARRALARAPSGVATSPHEGTVRGRLHRFPGLTLGAAMLYGVLSLWVVDASLSRVRAMAADRDVRNEYLNNQYVTARFLARLAKPGSRVLVVTPAGRRDWSPGSIAYWVYAGRHLRIEGIPRLPDAGALAPGTLVVVAAEGRPLTEREVSALEALGRQTGSLGTLDVYLGRGGRPLVASVCVGCEGVGGAGGF